MTEVGSPNGRYLISLDAVESRDPGQVVVHDMRSSSVFREQCNTDQIKRRSRFDDLQWAMAKGYRPCEHCIPAQETLP